MSLEHILLGMLQKPATGYDLKAEFEAGAKFFWSAELGQIYPALQSMERKGWLRSTRRPSPNGPPRRVYRRTAKGTRTLHRWLRAEPIMGVERFAYIAQLIFHGELHDLEHTLQFVQQLRAKQAALLQILEDALADLSARYPDADAPPADAEFHEWLCLNLGARAVSARVAWCDEAVHVIRRRLARPHSTKEHPHV